VSTRPIGRITVQAPALAYRYDASRRASLRTKWVGMRILRQQAQIEEAARALIAKKAIYLEAQAATGVPWWMIGVIDAREGGISELGTRHLHCGDPLTDYTVHVPRGRPKLGHGPPFTWLESAVDALILKGLGKIKNWTIERVLHELEPYNGLGYFNRGISSPYIWSCTNNYDPPFGPGGKYVADHEFDPAAVDAQLGCAPVIKTLVHLDSSSPLKTEATSPTRGTSAPAGASRRRVIVAAAVTAGGVAAMGVAARQGAGAVAITGIVLGTIVVAAAAWMVPHRPVSYRSSARRARSRLVGVHDPPTTPPVHPGARLSRPSGSYGPPSVGHPLLKGEYSAAPMSHCGSPSRSPSIGRRTPR
jgi:lysozyme family protein